MEKCFKSTLELSKIKHFMLNLPRLRGHSCNHGYILSVYAFQFVKKCFFEAFYCSSINKNT